MSKRILIAGHEIGGQMQLLATTFRSLGHQAHAVAFNSDYRRYKADILIPHELFPIRRAAFMLKAISHYDVFHFFWGVSLLDFWRFYGIDLPVLRALGKKIVVHFRGSDIINLKYYTESDPGQDSKSTELQKRKVRYWRRFAHKVLVSTPNLLDAAGPGACVVPQVIDVDYWRNTEQYSSTSTIRIVHAPTRRAIKGTDAVIRVIENLRKSGLPLELCLLEGTPYHQIKDEMARADIGIDQLRLGWYGKVAVEFMALGKPVISYIDPIFRSYADGLPIISANEHTLEQVLSELVNNVAWQRRLGEAGVAYAAAHHDVRLIASRLLELYDSI